MAAGKNQRKNTQFYHARYNGLVPAFTAIIERDTSTGLYVGWIPGVPGAHSQAVSLDELDANLKEVLALLADDAALTPQSELVGTHTLQVG